MLQKLQVYKDPDYIYIWYETKLWFFSHTTGILCGENYFPNDITPYHKQTSLSLIT